MQKIAEIWGRHIILGDRKYADVPAKLKDYVRQYLVEKRREDLIIEL